MWNIFLGFYSWQAGPWQAGKSVHAMLLAIALRAPSSLLERSQQDCDGGWCGALGQALARPRILAGSRQGTCRAFDAPAHGCLLLTGDLATRPHRPPRCVLRLQVDEVPDWISSIVALGASAACAGEQSPSHHSGARTWVVWHSGCVHACGP